MKICFFSDAHGNIDAVNAFFQDIEKRKIDITIYGGDCFGYFYEVNEVINILREKKTMCILGNHDKMFLDMLDKKIPQQDLCKKYGNTYQGIEDRISESNVCFLQNLKSEIIIEVDNQRLLFVHGSIDNHINGRIYPDTQITNVEEYQAWDAVFMGHTHHKMKRNVGSCMLYNSGSVGQPRDGKGTSYVIYDTSTRCCDFFTFEYDYNRLIGEIKIRERDNREMEEKLIELVTRKCLV